MVVYSYGVGGVVGAAPWKVWVVSSCKAVPEMNLTAHFSMFLYQYLTSVFWIP